MSKQTDWAKEREAIKARVDPPVFTGVVCRGDSTLGTACGKCERCLWYQTHSSTLRSDVRTLLTHAEEDEREIERLQKLADKISQEKYAQGLRLQSELATLRATNTEQAKRIEELEPLL